MNQTSVSGQLRHAVPVLVCSVLLLLAVTPAPFSWLPIYPNILLMTVFFFTLYAPATMPVLAVFVLGVLADITLGAPMGLNATLSVLLQLAMEPARRLLSRQVFRVLWASFAVVAIGYTLATYAALRLLDLEHGTMHASLPYLASTMLFYPLVHHFYSYLLRRMPNT
jgi:rod shape-determining protein MreD